MITAAYFIRVLFDVLSLAILARVFLSWVQVDPYHPAIQLLYQVTEPILAPLRNVIPPVGMFDISPIVALLLLQFIERLLLSIIFGSFGP